MALKDPLRGWKKKITRIDKMSMVDCVPDPFAVIAGFAVGVFHIWWAVNGPECIDSAWDRVNKGKGRHRKMIARGFSQGPTLNPPPGVAGITMVKLGGLAQKIGFGFAIIDGFLNGVYYGSSLVRRYSGCRNITEPHAQMTMTNALVELFPPGDGPVGQWNLVGRQGMGTSPQAINFTTAPKGQYSVYYSLKQAFNTVPGIADCTFTSRVVDTVTGREVQGEWSPYALIPGSAQQNYIEDHIFEAGAHNLEVWVNKGPGILAIESANFVVQAGKYHAPMSAYECGEKINVVS